MTAELSWPSFTDALERRWTFEIETETIKRLRSSIDVDLLSIFEAESTLLKRLATDQILLVDTISLILSAEIERRKLSARDFAKGLVGDAIDRATDALIEAIGFFSPRHQREILNSLWRQQKGANQQIADKIQAASPKMATVINQKIDQAIATVLDDLSAQAPKTSGS